MKIEYITHASLLIQTQNCCLLTDPFYFHDELSGSFNCFFPNRELTPEYFPYLDYVYCSHIHDDHCHEHTMKLLRNKIDTILLPAGKSDLEKKIRSYGFDKFIFLENEVTLSLPEGIQLTCYHDPNKVDSALMIESEGLVILDQNDCRLDLDGFRRMAARFSVDYAFFPHRGNQGLYPFLLPRSETILQKLSYECEYKELEYFAECIKILRPKYLIPYSFTVFYSNDDQLRFNGYFRTRPSDFNAFMQREIPGQKCLEILPGDYFTGISGELHYVSTNKENLWGTSLDDFLELGKKYCQSLPSSRRSFDYGNLQNIDTQLQSYLEERLCLPLPDYYQREMVVLHVVDSLRQKKSYYIDAINKTVSSSITEGFPFLEITIPASLIACFLDKKYDSFMILYSYRIEFLCHTLMFMNLTPQEECYFYVRAVLALFDTELFSQEIVF